MRTRRRRRPHRAVHRRMPRPLPRPRPAAACLFVGGTPRRCGAAGRLGATGRSPRCSRGRVSGAGGRGAACSAALLSMISHLGSRAGGRGANGRLSTLVTLCGVHWATGPSALAVLLVGAGCCTCTGTTARRRRHPSDTTLSGSRASSARRRANVARVAHRGNAAAILRHLGGSILLAQIDRFGHSGTAACMSGVRNTVARHAPVRPVLSECSRLHARCMRGQH